MIIPILQTVPSRCDLVAAQWLRLRTCTAGGMGSIPGRGTKIPHAAWCGQKKKKRCDLPFGAMEDTTSRGGGHVGPTCHG